jgi:hypothetical protein
MDPDYRRKMAILKGKIRPFFVLLSAEALDILDLR